MPPVFGPRSSSTDPLVILRGAERHARASPSHEDEERDLGSGEALLDHEPRAGGAELPIEHRRADGRLGLRRVLGDDDALAGGEAVGLDDDREAEVARRTRRRAPRRRSSQTTNRAVGMPWRAMKSLA